MFTIIVIFSVAFLITTCSMYMAYKNAGDVCKGCKDDCEGCPYADF